jgi:hypothetical protein
VNPTGRAANCTPYRQAALTAVITCRQTDVQGNHRSTAAMSCRQAAQTAAIKCRQAAALPTAALPCRQAVHSAVITCLQATVQKAVLPSQQIAQPADITYW